MAKLSIITINYNNAAGLQKTMESVFAQSFTDYEYIIIDGASTDGSVELVRKYEDKFFKWISENDKGPYDAMNKGLQMASGEYVQFLNSADLFSSTDSLQKCFLHSSGNEADIIYGQINVLWGDRIRTIGYPTPLTISFLKQYNINHQASFYRRKLLTELEGFASDYILAADYALLLECVMLKASFRYLPFAVIDYDVKGMSTHRMTEYIAEMEKAWKAIIPESINLNLKELQSLKIKASGRPNLLLRFFLSKLSSQKKEEAVYHFPERQLDY